MQASCACLTEAGIRYEEWEPFKVVPGYRWPAYSWQTTVAGMSDDQATAIGDACVYEHPYCAEIALQDRRNYADLLDAQMRQEMPEIDRDTVLLLARALRTPATASGPARCSMRTTPRRHRGAERPSTDRGMRRHAAPSGTMGT